MIDDTMPAIVTAGLLVIGDEILSGRTKDKNIGYIAEYLTGIGIDLREVRVVADDEAAIVEALNALRVRYAYVFTTGGIGPTHDDITADAVATAFGVPIEYDQRVVALLKERYAAMGTELNAARMRMTRVPQGAELVPNKVSAAPGFWIGNVIVMAGVPSIMQAMLDEVAPQLRTGIKMLSETVRADCREGDGGTELGEIAEAYPEGMIGSYPFMDEVRGPHTNIGVRARDPGRLAAANAAIEAMRDELSARTGRQGESQHRRERGRRGGDRLGGSPSGSRGGRGALAGTPAGDRRDAGPHGRCRQGGAGVGGRGGKIAADLARWGPRHSDLRDSVPGGLSQHVRPGWSRGDSEERGGVEWRAAPLGRGPIRSDPRTRPGLRLLACPQESQKPLYPNLRPAPHGTAGGPIAGRRMPQIALVIRGRMRVAMSTAASDTDAE